MDGKHKFVGDLVRLRERYHDGYGLGEWQLGEPKIGIVTERADRDLLLDGSVSGHCETILKVLFVETGKEEEWSEWDVELISEGK